MNDQIAQKPAAYSDVIIERLLGNYLSNAPLPSRTDSLSPDLLHRLCRAVLAEGYGNWAAQTGSTDEQ